MATTVKASGADYLGNPAGLSNEGSLVAGTTYGGFTDPYGDITDQRTTTNMTFVCRYLARPGAGTGLLTTSEVSNLLAANISIVFICENVNIKSSTAFTGQTQAFNQGVTDANTCKTNLASLGISFPQVVYFAADYNYAVSLSDWVPAYIAGASSVMGLDYTGLYGNGALWKEVGVGQGGSGGASYFWQSMSAGWNGNGAVVSGQNLWQWPGSQANPPSGYNPSGTLYIGGYAVDGDVALTNYFGQYQGTTPPPTPTVIYNSPITVTPNITPVTQTNIITPENEYDKVIYSNTIIGSVTSSSWPQNIEVTDTGIGQTAFPMGNFAYSFTNSNFYKNTGLSYNDFGYIYQNTYGVYGDLPEVVIQPIVSDTGVLSFDITVVNPNGTQTIYYLINIALRAPQNAIAMPNYPRIQQTSAYGTFTPTPNNPAMFRRIYKDYEIGTDTNTTIPISFGKVPNIIAYTNDASSTYINAAIYTSAGLASQNLSIGVTDTAIEAYVSSSNGNTGATIRVYEDN